MEDSLECALGWFVRQTGVLDSNFFQGSGGRWPSKLADPDEPVENAALKSG